MASVWTTVSIMEDHKREQTHRNQLASKRRHEPQPQHLARRAIAAALAALHLS
jgi:hypothetical protein